MLLEEQIMHTKIGKLGLVVLKNLRQIIILSFLTGITTYFQHFSDEVKNEYNMLGTVFVGIFC